MNKLTIRSATIADAPTIYQFIRELAIYEKAEHEVVTTVADIEENLFRAGTTTAALIALKDAQPIGFAVYFLSYSTWLGRHGIFLEDLFVMPEARGLGAGKRLLKRLAEMAVENGYGRVDWNVLTWNEPALNFYRAIGAKPQDEWIGYRLEGESLQNFAALKNKNEQD
ncbi:MAG: GNAT family N-acetyltransferase [Chloroflexota bacterium]